MNKFYHKERISERLIELDTSTLPTLTYPGLHVLMRHPRLEFGNMDISSEVDWLQVAKDTIYQSIMHLVAMDRLTILKTEDKTSVLFNLLKFKSSRYHFTRLDEAPIEDQLCQKIMQGVSFVNKKYPKKSTCTKLIHVLLDSYLGRNEDHNNPSKEFVKGLIQSYDKFEEWFHLEVDKKFLGIVRNYSLYMDEDMFQKLVEQHMDFGIFLVNNEREMTSIRDFKRELFNIIGNDLRGRRPKDNN